MTRAPLVVALVLSGCSTTRALAPLAKGQSGVTISVGGPFIQYGGGPLPLPISSIGYRYGIDGRSDVHAAFYPTGTILFGVAGFDLGINRELVTAHKARPRLMLDMTHYVFFGDTAAGDPAGGARWFPDVSAVLTWDLGNPAKPHRIYVAVDGFFQTMPELNAFVSPLLGVELRAHERLGIQLEAGIHGFWVDTLPMQPVWYGINHHGAFSAKLGFNIYLPTPDGHRRDKP